MIRALASAYLSVFDDWHLLEGALRTIAPYVEEIVVVDGAYRWMAPFFVQMGRDPARSDFAVNTVLAQFGDKIRYISGVWENEPEKRMAGYKACSHRYIYRIDADEHLFMDDLQLDRFFASGCAVAQMGMPIYLAPGWILAQGPHSAIERQSLLFDSHKISAAAHLAYLWLVLPSVEQLRLPPPDAGMIFAEAIAFNAHLTHWRPPASAVGRARFYVLNYARNGGRLPWLPPFSYNEADGFGDMFSRLQPGVLDDVLRGHAIVAEPPVLTNRMPRATPLSATQEQKFCIFYARFLQGLADLNTTLIEQPRAIAYGVEYAIDLSLQPVVDGTSHKHVRFRFAGPISVARIIVSRLRTKPPYLETEHVIFEMQNGGLVAEVPLSSGCLRQTLKLTVWQGDLEGTTSFVMQ